MQNIKSVLLRQLSLTLLAVALLLPFACTQAAQAGYTSYYNVRFDYQVDYPHALLTPEAESSNADGKRFINKDKKIVMLVWGSHFPADSLQHYDEVRRNFFRNAKIMQNNKRRDGFVISATKDGKVLYYKAVMRNDTNINLYITYPVAQQKVLAAIVKNIGQSFQFMPRTNTVTETSDEPTSSEKNPSDDLQSEQ